MRKIYSLLVLGMLAGCSSPKYTASFPNYDKSYTHQEAVVSNAQLRGADEVNKTTSSPEFSASTSDRVAEPAKTEIRKTYLQMSKVERKQLRKEIKTQVKAYVKAVKSAKIESVKSTKSNIDHDLKLAAIFGAVGLVAMIIGGDVFWVIGGIALIIGVVFLVKWLIRQ